MFPYCFSYNLGSGAANIAVNGTFSDGKWHRVKAVRWALKHLIIWKEIMSTPKPSILKMGGHKMCRFVMSKLSRVLVTVLSLTCWGLNAATRLCYSWFKSFLFELARLSNLSGIHKIIRMIKCSFDYVADHCHCSLQGWPVGEAYSGWLWGQNGPLTRKDETTQYQWTSICRYVALTIHSHEELEMKQ